MARPTLMGGTKTCSLKPVMCQIQKGVVGDTPARGPFCAAVAYAVEPQGLSYNSECINGATLLLNRTLPDTRRQGHQIEFQRKG